MGKRKKPVMKPYHIRYTSDVIVRASSTKEAFAKSDEFMYDMLEQNLELDDLFEITMESTHFNIVPEEYFAEDDEETPDEGNGCPVTDDDDDDDDDDEAEDGK